MQNSERRIEKLLDSEFFVLRSAFSGSETVMKEKNLLVFERPPVSRIVSCAASFGSAAIFFMYLAAHPEDYEILPIVGLILLFLGTLAAAILQYGDHIY